MPLGIVVWYGGGGLTEGLMGLSMVSEVLGKGKEKAKSRVLGPANMTTEPAATPTPLAPLFQQQQRLSDALLSVTPVVASLVPPTLARQLRREDIVRRAREQRAAIQAELGRGENAAVGDDDGAGGDGRTGAEGECGR